MKRAYFWTVCLLLMSLGIGCSKQAPPTTAASSDSEAAPSTAAPDSRGLPFGQMPAANKVEAKTLLPSMTIPAGTLVSVRLQTAVSSANSSTGDTFDAVLDDPLVVDGREVAPRGAVVRGKVTAARRSGHMNHSGYLRLTLTSVEVEGKAVPLQTSSIFVQGGAHKNRNIAMIGGGAGAGSLIGAIAGGGKGALIGGLVGAGAGTGTAYATGKKDVGFGVERRLTFRLTQPVNVS